MIASALRRLGVVVAAAALLAACHASPTTVCNRGCEKTVACFGGTTQQIAQCQANADCAHQDENPQNCTRQSIDEASDCAEACLEKPCNEVVKCLNGCPKCVTQ